MRCDDEKAGEARKVGPSTRSVHAGEPRKRALDALAAPLSLSATFTFENTAALIDYREGRAGERDEYARYGHPTQRLAEAKLAAIEGAQACVLFSSGMAALTGPLLAMLSQGAHVVAAGDSYRRTRQFLVAWLSRYGVSASFIPTGDAAALREALTPKTRIVLTESPTNPFVQITDLRLFAEMAHAAGARLLVDSTLATPLNQRPLELGADLVVHSATKYLGGHNDLMAGAVLGNAETIEALREASGVLGATPDPHASYLLVRGLKTLALRVARQNESAQAIAELLAGHPRVSRVFYPGLSSHPGHDVARAQMSGFGGLVSFLVDGDGAATSKLVDAVRIPYIAPSLGGVESLIEQPALMSYYEMDPDARAALGISDSLVRMSVGIEDTNDLLADLQQALEQI